MMKYTKPLNHAGDTVHILDTRNRNQQTGHLENEVMPEIRVHSKADDLNQNKIPENRRNGGILDSRTSLYYPSVCLGVVTCRSCLFIYQCFKNPSISLRETFDEV